MAVKKIRNWIVRGLALAYAVIAVSGAAAADIQRHGFEFNLVHDSPSVEMLNYRYGNSKQTATHPAEWQLEQGAIPQTAAIYGDLLKGDFLYAKWRVKATGQIFEETVDLRKLLPQSVENQTVYVTIDGRQLYIFLISSEKLIPNPCPISAEARRLARSGKPVERVLSKYCDLKLVRLYPSTIDNNN
jgi:hypothetical protein